MRSSDTSDISVFRSDRIFVVNGLWYFATREGVSQGPFSSQREATLQVERFVKDLESCGGMSLGPLSLQPMV